MKVFCWIGLLFFCLLTACSKKEKTPSDGASSNGGGAPSGGGFATPGDLLSPCEDPFILVYNNLDSIYLKTVQMISSPSVSDKKMRSQLISLQNNCSHFLTSHSEITCEAALGSSTVIIGTSDFSLVCDSVNKELSQFNQKLGLQSDTSTDTDDRNNNDESQTSDVTENQDFLLNAPEVIDVPDAIDLPESTDSMDSDLEEVPTPKETPKRKRPVPPPLIGE